MRHIILTLLFVSLSLTVAIADTEKTLDQTEITLRHLDFLKATKSGTPALLRLLSDNSEEAKVFKAAYSKAGRPEMDTFADSFEGRFRVHYDLSGSHAPDLTDSDLNGVPDYVDSTLVYLEYAWQIIVVELGYGQPKYDGTRGGLPRDIIDCYLKDLYPQRVYGLTNPDDSGGGAVSSYITIDNSFTENIYGTKGYDAVKITTAHEFFHVIHYTYYGGYDSVWWMEQTAVWLEDRAWDDVNDYLNYLGFLYIERDLPLDWSNSNFMYGATLFAFHIAEKYGENTLRSVWSKFRDKRNGDIENLNSVLPEGLDTAISDLAVWMYFTGYRANEEDYFEEAGLITNTIIPDRITPYQTTVDSLTFRHYTFKYIEISPDEGFSYGDSLYFEFGNPDNGIWKNRVIFYSSPDNYEVFKLTGDSPSLFVPRPLDKAVLVITNYSERDKSFKYVYKIDIVSSKDVKDEPLPVPFALHQNYPNPFNNSTTIPYSIQEKSHITLKIKNIQGATVGILVDDLLYPGSYSASFDASNLSSGPYFVVLESENSRAVKKISLVK